MSEEIKMMKVFNKGKREIHYAGGGILKPEKDVNIEENEAKKLMRLFPKEIIELSQIKVIDNSKALSEELSQKENEMKGLKAEIEGLKKTNKELEAKVAELQSVNVTLKADNKRKNKDA